MRMKQALGTFVMFAAMACGASCGGTGGDGQPCTSTNAPPLGGLTCDEGLVCNDALPSTVCEKPNTHAAGDPCSGDDNCRTGLRCTTGVCKPLLAEGEGCGTPTDCASGLACTKEDGGEARCAPSSSGANDAAPE
jgi:hypothetical protein